MPSLQTKHDSWLFIVPIYNLEIHPDLKGEITIQRVTFISTEKLKKVRKRFGIQKRISEMHDSWKELFQRYNTFALVRNTGTIDEIQAECFKIVQRELNYLLSSFMVFKRRSYKNQVGIAGEIGYQIQRHAFLSTTSNDSLHNSSAGNFRPLSLDLNWKTYQRKYFFYHFSKVLDGSLLRGYKKEISRAVELMGKSYNSNIFLDSFLWNMIAIELLISVQGDTYREILQKRLTALFGWMGNWQISNYERRIDEVYRKRSAYVHDGNLDTITVQDLLFTDDLLFNLVVNIVMHPDIFPSKVSLIDFTKKVEAEKLLGLPSKIHPKTMCFLAPQYSDEDLKMLR